MSHSRGSPHIKGRLTWADVAISPDGAKTIFSYDAMGRVIMSAQCRPSTCGHSNNQMNYTYDLAGNMLTSTDGAAVTSTYTVSLANELQSLTSSQTGTDNPSGLISSVQNGVFGPSTYSLGNGLTSIATYDTLGRTNGGWVCSGTSDPNCTGGTGYYGFTSTWTGVRQLGGCDTVLNQCLGYGYDEFNRLTSRTVTTGTPQNYSYTYDRYGNRWAQTVTSGSGLNSSLSFNSANNQVTTSGTAYDAAGNMTNDGNYLYTYDAEGRIVTVKNEGGGTTLATYLYDALGHRVQTVVGSANTEFVFNPAGQRVSTWNGATGAQIQGQYYWGGKPVAFYKGGQTYFQHQDWEGTERLRTTYNGSTEGAFASLPFGDALQLTAGSDNDAYHYGMLDHDYESDTEHAQFRQYNSAQGHWLSPDPYQGSYDPSNPQSLNRYVYTLNNTLSNVDPSGLVMLPPPIDLGGVCWEYGLCAEGDGGAGNGSSNGGGPGKGPLAPSNSPCLVGAGPLQVGQSRCANATVKCRGIETDNLGAIGFQHCDAQVTDCNGAVYSVSAGPVNNYMNSGQQAMNAWAVSPPTAPFTGNTVWQGNLTCTQSACLFETTQEWNQSVVKPLYHPVTGPNSNNFLWNTFAGCAVTALPINTWGPIW
jgi:RHS repeat-associated protein